MKRIASYRHRALPGPAGSFIDLRPGHYYVTIIDGPRYGFLLGPYHNNHAAAIRDINLARELAHEVDPFSDFASFGTARIPLEMKPRVGVLNDMAKERANGH